MAFRITVVFLGFIAIATTAIAQTRNPSEEVIALQQEVFGRPAPPWQEFPTAVTAQLALANAYAAGNGIERDEEFACGLTQVAENLAAAINGDERFAVRARVTRDEMCARVPDRTAAFDLARCPRFGLEPQLIDLGNGARLRVSRTHWTIEDLAGTHEGWWGLNCNDIVVSMRRLRVDPPADSRGSVRQFVEFFVWRQGFFEDGTPTRTLDWELSEFDSAHGELLPCAGYTIVESKGAIWPAPPVPVEFSDGATLWMLPSGVVRWRFEGAPRSASGLIEGLPTCVI